MALFVLGDPHLSIGCDKPMDVFGGWEDYVEKIRSNWCATVGIDDTVVLAGDISWGMTLEEARPDFAFLHELPGKKIILKGNHDYWWTTRRKIEEFFAKNGFYSLNILHNNCFAVDNIAVCGTRGWILETGAAFDAKIVNREAMRLEASLKEALRTGLEPFVFLHYPPVYGNEVCAPIMDILKEYVVRRCYYGHIHSTGIANAVRGYYRGIMMRLISCDAIGFAPLKVETDI